jgi:hypothetical protein
MLTRAGLLALLFAAICCLPLHAAPKPQPSRPEMQDRLQDILRAGFIDASGIGLPAMTPHVAPLKRSYVPGRDKVLTQFFGGQQGVTSTEQLTSPIYGKGTRFKSGKVVYLTPKGVDLRAAASQQKKAEYVAASLDLYNSGFVYVNNVPHSPVLTTDVRMTGQPKAKVTRRNIFTDQEGRHAAEQILTEMFGGLKASAGFQINVQSAVQDVGEKLYVYRANPEYLAKVDILTAGGAKQQTTTGITVRDIFVNLQLDGDKLLAGMEYFWDGGLVPTAQPKPGMSWQEAFQIGKKGVFKVYKGQPPQMTVSDVTLGYILDRKNRNVLVPVWIYAATYAQPETKADTSGLVSSYAVTNFEAIARPFAVNVLNGDFYALWQ